MSTFDTVRELPDIGGPGPARRPLAPYLGPGMLGLCAGGRPPADPLALAAVLTARISVPGQDQEPPDRRRAVHRELQAPQDAGEGDERGLCRGARAVGAAPLAGRAARTADRRHLVRRHVAPARSWPASDRVDWAEVQGLSQSEHFGTWIGWYDALGAGAARPRRSAARVLYKPWGGHAPAGNYLVSDSDFVEVLTEIDIQTPIPPSVQQRRSDARLRLPRLPLQRSTAARLCAPDHEAFGRPALRRAARRAHAHGSALPGRTGHHAHRAAAGRGGGRADRRPAAAGRRLNPIPLQPEPLEEHP